MNGFDFLPSTASDAGFSSGPLEELRLFLNTLVGNGNLPGAVIFLARGNKVVLHEAIGRGDLADPRPLRTDALFRLYSMTKPLTAVAMLLLYEEGKWNFDDPLSIHIPEFRDFAGIPGNRASREPVLREIFTHTSGHGLGETLEEMFANAIRLDVFGSTSLKDLVGKYASLPLLYEPGTRWAYGIGMDLQATIVERISGLRFDRFMQQRFFEPLGMIDTSFALNDEQAARLVPGYALDSETRRFRPGNEMEMQEAVFAMGGTSFRSTAADFARFARMLLNRGSLGETHILKPETVDLMFTNMLPDELLKQDFNALHYTVGGGNGFSLNGRLCIDPVAAERPVGRNTYEWAGAHGTWFWADPEHDIVFVGMTNRMMPHPEFAPLSNVAQDLIYKALDRA